MMYATDKRRYFRYVALCWWWSIVFIAGCGSNTEPPKTAIAVAHTRSQVEDGPVRVTAELQPAQPRLCDPVTLTLTYEYEEGVVLEKPQFGTKIDKLLIRNLREPLARIEKGRFIEQQIYTLEAEDIGRVRIDPIPVVYTDNRKSGDNQKHTLTTKPLSLEITSIHGDKTPGLNDLRGPVGPIGLETSGLKWLGIVVAVLIAIAIYLVKRRRLASGNKNDVVPQRVITAEQWAAMELEKLLSSNLAATDVKAFYIRLTDIVRRYIERTTGIHAPEQTTEEFLREISRANRFDQDMRLRLQYFLEAADLVKFAAYRPGSEDVEESVRRARILIKAEGFSSQEAENNARLSVS